MNEFWGGIWSIAFLIGVCGNLVAALLWAVPALRRLHKKIDANHLEHINLMKLHHKEQLNAIRSKGTERPILRS
jgi:hypothetical protein